VLLGSDGAAIKPTVLRDVGRFLNFDGIETSPQSPIFVDLCPAAHSAGVRALHSVMSILSRETQRALEFGVTLRWEGGSPGVTKEPVAELLTHDLLREVVVLLTPERVESLEGRLSSLARMGVPSVSLQMEYARRWSLYEYYLVERMVRRLEEAGWRMGGTSVRLGEPMCRQGRGAMSCGAGVSKVAIASDGTLYPCHRFAADRTRPIGTAGMGFWPGVLALQKCRADQNEGCRGCPLLPRCDACCIWLNLRETGRIVKTTSAVCEFTKMIYSGGGGAA
jgi:radical SAM protein with 4Fe4S-binding SPASM domain